MYTELDKYKTGNSIKVPYKIVGQDISVNINEQEYLFNLGDLLLDFNKHLSKWFWQRKSYHNHLTEIYIKILNEISFKRSF